SSFLLLSFSIILPYLIVDLKLCNRTIFNIFVTILGLFELIQMNFFSFTHGIFTWFALSGLIVIDILNYFYIYYSYLKNEKFFYTMFFPLVILIILLS
ncbi:hypothetical protein ABXM68_13305, partial [Enterococcus faecium]